MTGREIDRSLALSDRIFVLSGDVIPPRKRSIEDRREWIEFDRSFFRGKSSLWLA